MRKLGLTHPAKFRVRKKPLKAISDMNERISQRFDNVLLKQQQRLVQDVVESKVSLEDFSATLANYQDASAKHAELRPGGVTKKEWTTLRRELSTEKQTPVTPEKQALYDKLKNGELEPQEVVEELQWQSYQSYGEVAQQRDGIIFRDERAKLRAHLYQEGKSPQKQEQELFVHPKLEPFLNQAISLFPTLDANSDGEVDRLEARKLLTDHEALGVSPSFATTLYSRQLEIANVVELKPGNESVTLDDLKALLPQHHSNTPSPTFQRTLTRLSKRLDFEENRQTPEPLPFLLGDKFEPLNVHQGREGSCWILGNLPLLSQEELTQLIQPEGDKFRVTLQDGRTTLVHSLNEAERRIYSAGDGAWSGLLEKGMSQILEDEGRDITGGPAAEAREMFSGKSPQRVNLLRRDPLRGPELRDRKVLVETLEKTLETGGGVMAAALPEDYDEGISPMSAAGHAYTVLALDREQEQVVLRNAWGRGEKADIDGTNDGVFTLSQDQFFANFSLLDLG